MSATSFQNSASDSRSGSDAVLAGACAAACTAAGPRNGAEVALNARSTVRTDARIGPLERNSCIRTSRTKIAQVPEGLSTASGADGHHEARGE